MDSPYRGQILTARPLFEGQADASAPGVPLLCLEAAPNALICVRADAVERSDFALYVLPLCDPFNSEFTSVLDGQGTALHILGTLERAAQIARRVGGRMLTQFANSCGPALSLTRTLVDSFDHPDMREEEEGDEHLLVTAEEKEDENPPPSVEGTTVAVPANAREIVLRIQLQ